MALLKDWGLKLGVIRNSGKIRYYREVSIFNFYSERTHINSKIIFYISYVILDTSDRYNRSRLADHVRHNGYRSCPLAPNSPSWK